MCGWISNSSSEISLSINSNHSLKHINITRGLAEEDILLFHEYLPYHILDYLRNRFAGNQDGYIFTYLFVETNSFQLYMNT